MANTKWIRKEAQFEWMQKGLFCWKKCEQVISLVQRIQKYTDVVNACRDTAEMCSQCIKFEMQRSPFIAQLCVVCADVCEHCAQALGKYESDDAIIKEAVYACKVFAVACLDVANSQKENIGLSEEKFTTTQGVS